MGFLLRSGFELFTALLLTKYMLLFFPHSVVYSSEFSFGFYCQIAWEWLKCASSASTEKLISITERQLCKYLDRRIKMQYSMVIIISTSFASQKMMEAVIEVLGDTDSSVLAVSIGTEAEIQDWKGPCFQVPSPLIFYNCPLDT